MTFWAPSSANFTNVFNAGKSYWSRWGLSSANGQFGENDFQRNRGAGLLATRNNIFFNAYTNASNYAVGVSEAGYGFDRATAISFPGWYARNHSSNAGDPQQWLWTAIGWNAATGGWQEPIRILVIP